MVVIRRLPEGEVLPAELPDPLPGGGWSRRLAGQGQGEAAQGLHVEAGFALKPVQFIANLVKS